MTKQMKKKYLNGTKSEKIQEYELLHRGIARKAAAEGIVLLENENLFLPLPLDTKIALYGSGSIRTIKGGTGSGDVNEREVIHIRQCMKEAGFLISNEEYLDQYELQYEEGKKNWKDSIWAQVKSDELMEIFNVYCSTKFVIPVGNLVEKAEEDTETAIYVLSRVAGEGADRFAEKGDYYLLEAEEAQLSAVCRCYKNVILVINTGGLIDLEVFRKWEEIRSILYLSQPGMEGGRAFADVLCGKCTPSGKLTDSWGYHYEDYPNSASFSHNNGNVAKERYEEGIYIGYRYFDTFDVPVRYGFGYGLSYTAFDTEIKELKKEINKDGEIAFTVTAEVTNTGSMYSGKETIQIYCTAPQGKLEKEYRRLVGFSKTKELAPGEKQELEIHFLLYQMTSFDETEPGWLLEKGDYILWAGNSLAKSNVFGRIKVDDSCILVRTQNICAPEVEIKELSLPEEARKKKYDQVLQLYKEASCFVCRVGRDEITTKSIEYSLPDLLDKQEKKLLLELEQDKKICLVIGDPAKGIGSNIGSAGISVSGAAGETTSCVTDKNIPSIVLADGPAGLRINSTYPVKDGIVQATSFLKSLEGGYLVKETEETKGEIYHQYCTAFPVGTMLAQTWNRDLLKEVGHAVGEELQLFQVTLWLAPGMNIHRNPLCGRNFEYYSEDPYVSGCMAAALTHGVQSIAGCGTTIKHFACNNQEDNRMGSDSIVSERTLREIYLRGFEIAVKTAQPMSIMTSYNKVNGIHAANNFDLCTKAARMEWGFQGVIMTDWLTTVMSEHCTAAGCMRAGNDLVMPGQQTDLDNLKEELNKGTLSEKDLEKCAANVLRIIAKSNQYREAEPYLENRKLESWF